MPDLVSSIRERYLQTQERIDAAARAAGRDVSEVRLVVVTKSQPVEVVQAAVDAGVRILGENYPEEGVMKIQSVREASAVEWHMIGHVQSRKAGLVAANYHMMHSLDGQKLAERLDRFAEPNGRRLAVLLEFNLGAEESKYGWPAQAESSWDKLAGELEPVLTLPNLHVQGLMCMPPLGETAEASRSYFRKLRALRDFLSKQFPGTNLTQLSMGTSADFEVAVQEGSTLVRVGTAIVGSRSN
ncbi:MAG TPA: YggS family pyridoxal phosphate-dependent enzyme [Anaerolineales bacterium]|jgi:hypothetical protein